MTLVLQLSFHSAPKRRDRTEIRKLERPSEDYAPFRGEPGCVSRAGRARRRHAFDRDGVCCWCDAVAPESVPF